MRVWSWLLILSCTALAQEDAAQPKSTSRAEVTLQDGVATHAFWDFRFRADGLVLDTLPPPPRINNRCASPLVLPDFGQHIYRSADICVREAIANPVRNHPLVRRIHI